MFTFVMSDMKQNKKRKQTLESAQYRLEITFIFFRFVVVVVVATVFVSAWLLLILVLFVSIVFFPLDYVHNCFYFSP